jgi:translation initiation factor IF-2
MLVKDLAEMLSVSPNELITKLIASGVFANINQVIDYKAAAAVATELGFEPSEAAPPPSVSAAKTEMVSKSAENHPRLARPPVVVVMGHVDHGKTSLLDAIRKTKVAAGEAGGITQHIGAYQVETADGRPVTFLDTPGHEAFTAMRARGAKVTDVAIIVVAADDGVMPQTIEAIDHARAAQVPILVALNKIDKPNANPDFVKQQLAEHGVVIEEYGGDVVLVPVSAKKGENINTLLDMVLLVADVQDLKANPKGHAVGTVLEARVDKNSGIVANMLVQDGTLKIGDIIVAGTLSGKVRAMFDDTGARIKTAGPSKPVSVLALSEVPTAGDQFRSVPDERAARRLIEEHREAAARANSVVTLDTLYTQMQQGKVKELNLLLKADVQGSLDALRNQLTKISTDQLKVRLIHEGVGNISEADVHLASASKAIIIGFNVKPDGAAQRVAQNEHVDIRFYDVIYKLVDDIEAALKGMLEPVYKEVVEGHAEVVQIFKAGKTIIGGCRVTDGKLVRNALVKVLRGGKEIASGSFGSLKRGKDDVREVATGFECGLTVDGFNDLQVGDIIQASVKVRV